MSESINKISIFNETTKGSVIYDLQDSDAQQKIESLTTQFKLPIKDQVNAWLDSHPEAVTRVVNFKPHYEKNASDNSLGIPNVQAYGENEYLTIHGTFKFSSNTANTTLFSFDFNTMRTDVPVIVYDKFLKTYSAFISIGNTGRVSFLMPVEITEGYCYISIVVPFVSLQIL